MENRTPVEPLEAVIYELATKQFTQGETYKNTKVEGLRNRLQHEYGEHALKMYRRLPDYKRSEFVEEYGLKRG